MGLDMWLYGVKYNSARLNNTDKTTIVHTQELYWRKADMIHNWFVKNVQNGEDDCRTYEVSHMVLENLVNDCQRVIDNPEKASEILYSYYYYDDWYFNELKRTVREIKKLLKQNYDWFSYASSW